MVDAGSIVSLSRITVEHYEPGSIITEPSPRLSWSFGGYPADWIQSSYTLSISGHAPVWIHSCDSVCVPWPFDPLKSRDKVDVSVTSFGQDGTRASGTVCIEVGLLSNPDWQARWIGGGEQALDRPKRPVRFRCAFPNTPTANEGADLGQVRLYITARGVYDVHLNGVRISTEVLSPGWRDYRYFLPYAAHAIDRNDLIDGENVLEVCVGEGWYAGRLGGAAGQRNIWGAELGLLAQLEIDGQVVCSTESTLWEWSYGPIIRSEIYDGEEYDASRGHKGRWHSARILEHEDDGRVKLFIAQSPPVRLTQCISAKTILTSPSGKTIVDFGQNFGGVIEFLGQPGSGTITMRHAEVLEDGELCTRPLAYAKCTDTVRGAGPGYRPSFTFHGFRYCQIDGWPDLTLEDVRGVAIHSDMRRVGHFACSHNVLNKLHDTVIWSTMANTISLPTDCPQRDERLGWTADIQVFAKTMGYLFDCSAFLHGWLDDLYVEQRDADGVVPVFVPVLQPGSRTQLPQAAWGDVAVLLPIDLWEMSGDKQVLERQYDSVLLWLEKGVRRDNSMLWTRDDEQLADWLAPSADPRTPQRGPTDPFLVADAYLIHTTRRAAQIAAILGETVAQEHWQAEAAHLLDVFHETYFTPRGRMVTETQTALALILHFDLLRDKSKAELARRLADLVSKEFYQVSTGFLGTPIILQTLADTGHLAAAYRLLLAKQQPSWLSPVLLGATTTWERWDCMREDGSIIPGPMASFNHYALGSVASFLHSYVGGLAPLEPGWKKVKVCPRPGGNIRWTKTAHDGPYGLVQLEWKIEHDRLAVTVRIPANTTASLKLPGQGEEDVGSGVHHRSVGWEDDPAWPPEVEQAFFALPREVDWVRGDELDT